MDIFQLNKKQQKAFDALKRAADRCEKTGIKFVNCYGTIHAYDSKLIAGFGSKGFLDSADVAVKDYGKSTNTIDNLGGDSFADDDYEHWFSLTPKGKKVFDADEYKDL